MSPVGFEPTISAGERPQTYALDRAATGTGTVSIHSLVISLEGRAWQELEPSHVTGMALSHCILGRFFGGSLPLLSPAFRRSHFNCQLHPSATTREILAAKGGTVGEKDIR